MLCSYLKVSQLPAGWAGSCGKVEIWQQCSQHSHASATLGKKLVESLGTDRQKRSFRVFMALEMQYGAQGTNCKPTYIDILPMHIIPTKFQLRHSTLY